MAIPSFLALGTFASGTAGITPGLPAGVVAGDLLFLVVESANEVIANPNSSIWTELSASPQGAGTAAAIGAIRLTVFVHKVLASGAPSAPSIADSGNHTTAIIVAIRGADHFSPIHAIAGTTQAATTSIVFSSVTTSVADCLIVHFLANDRDIASTTNLTSAANAALGSVTIRQDQTVTSGVGGGTAIITGTKATAGSTGGTTVTNGASVTNASITVAVAPRTPLAADAGAYSFAGSQAYRALAITAAPASFALAGIAATLTDSGSAGTVLTANAGAFTETGVAAGLRVARRLSSAQGAFAFAGLSATLNYSAGMPRLLADPGAFIWSGAPSANAYAVTASVGTFALAGVSANLVKESQRSLLADAGAFVLTGSPTVRVLAITASPAVFSSNGVAARLAVQRAVISATGAFLGSGVAAALRTARVLTASAGAHTLAGQAAVLNYGAIAKVLQAQVGTFFLEGAGSTSDLSFRADSTGFIFNGVASSFKRAYVVQASSGTFTSTGLIAAISASKKLPSAAGAFALAGVSAAVRLGRVVPSLVGSFTLIGVPASSRRTYVCSATAGTFLMAGQQAALRTTGSYIVLANLGTVTVGGQPAVLRTSLKLPSAQAAFTHTGAPTLLRAGRSVVAVAGAFSVNGVAATLISDTADRSMQADRGLFALTGVPAGSIRYRTLFSSVGTFSTTFVPATLASDTANRVLTAERATFAFYGVDALVKYQTIFGLPRTAYISGESRTARI